ncbi:MAG: cell division protein ZapE [Pseudomonadota bacterium]
MSEHLPPAARYAADLQRQGFTADAAQASAVAALQKLFDELIAKPPKRSLLGSLGSKRPLYPPVKGLYFWGGVGRGKTYLMDVFYEALPFSAKRRTHFHRFMLDVHERRHRYPDVRDPLSKVAAEIAEETRVLCFDEFFVSDIADAMILGQLMSALFARGVTLVTTSNIVPDGLYKDGLQRANFLPAIAVLKSHVQVLNVDGGVDYRLRHLTDAELYLTPCDTACEARLADYFLRFAGTEGSEGVTLTIHGRELISRRHAEGVVWFDFSELCEGPRGAADYIELARTHHTLMLSHIPVLTVNEENEARRFITLIDELYDRNVKMVLAADAGIDKLYRGDRLLFEFERTKSRLIEMRTLEYLQRPHRP